MLQKNRNNFQSRVFKLNHLIATYYCSVWLWQIRIKYASVMNCNQLKCTVYTAHTNSIHYTLKLWKQTTTIEYYGHLIHFQLDTIHIFESFYM